MHSKGKGGLTFLPKGEFGNKLSYPHGIDQVNSVDAAGRRMLPGYIRPETIDVDALDTDNEFHKLGTKHPWSLTNDYRRKMPGYISPPNEPRAPTYLDSVNNRLNHI